MSLRPIWLVVPLLLFAIEGGVQAWRLMTQTSTAPVFYWKGAELLTTAPPPFGLAMEIYRADRGAEQTKLLPDGARMTLFYFEWDSIELGPIVAVGGHEAEVCNVAAGYKLVQSGGQRTRRFSNGEALRFDCTHLAEPGGRPVYVYKIPWIQGFGVWKGDSALDRTMRLRRSFLRHRGAGRVLEAGVFGAASEDEAWDLFQSEVLEKLEWK
jgi:hypothetical protein